MPCPLQLRRNTQAFWNSLNPQPAAGEPIFAVDTNVLKIGNGTDFYVDLTPINGSGSPGSGDDKNFVYTQAIPSPVWIVPHALGKYPAITVVDSANGEVEGEVTYNSLNQVTIEFSAAFSGKAFCN